MVASKEVKPLEHSSVELTVTVEKESAQKEYDDLVAKYAKTLAIKGFRKGKVPTAILIQKFGDSLLDEASANILENSLKEVFETIEKKPLPYSVPQLKDDVKLQIGETFTFTVTYDTFPEFTVGAYKEVEIEEPDVKISKDDEKRELDVVRDQNATVVEKKEGSPVAKDDIVTVNYVELADDDSEKPGTQRQDFVFTVGTGYNLYKFDDDVIGMKKGDERVITKDYPADFEYPELAGKKVKVKVTVTTVKEKQLPELDDELAQDVSSKYKTLQDLKDDVRKRLTDDLASRIRQANVRSIMDKIIERSEIDLPQAMVDAELSDTWHNFVAQNRVSESQLLRILFNQGKSREQLYEEWKPSVSKNLKSRLAMDKICELEHIEATSEDIEAEIKRQAELSNVPIEKVREQFQKNDLVHYLEHDIRDKKVFDLLIGSAVIKKGAKATYVDVVQKNG